MTELRKLLSVSCGLLGALTSCAALDSSEKSAQNSDVVADAQPTADATIAADAAPDAQSQCAANTERCDSNELTSCDAEGRIANVQACILGCFDETRCGDLDPANGLATHLDAAAATEDIAFTGHAIIDTDAGTIVDSSGLLTTSSGFGSIGSMGIMVLRVKSLQADDVTVVGTRALAIVSAGDIALRGHLKIDADFDRRGPGASLGDESCSGKMGSIGSELGWTGGGGGGFGAMGGSGGAAAQTPGGLAGEEAGNSELDPLRGGCTGGYSAIDAPSLDPDKPAPGAGGGAIQLVSATQITLSSTAIVSANGGGGKAHPEFSENTNCQLLGPCNPASGGGSGGAILLEAPVVNLASTAGLYSNGGSGSCGYLGSGSNGRYSNSPAPSINCIGSSGSGGAGDSWMGGSASSAAYEHASTAGGGGAVGRIRINVAQGDGFSPAGSVSPPASIGALGLR